MRRPIELEAGVSRAMHASVRYRLSPRETYVLRSAPIRGLGQSERRSSERSAHNTWTLWFVGDENLSNVVEGLLRRGLLTRRAGAGPACADLTAEGRRALEAGQIDPLR
jgi:hypothetical protein